MVLARPISSDPDSVREKEGCCSVPTDNEEMKAVLLNENVLVEVTLQRHLSEVLIGFRIAEAYGFSKLDLQTQNPARAERQPVEKAVDLVNAGFRDRPFFLVEGIFIVRLQPPPERLLGDPIRW